MRAPTAKPILFSGPMVLAILAGRKTQTRRVIKPQPKVTDFGQMAFRKRCNDGWWLWPNANEQVVGEAPYQPGDTLWVRETFSTRRYGSPITHQIEYRFEADSYNGFCLVCEKDEKYMTPYFVKRPSIFMPRWASRISLKVTDVRVQQVRDISEEDARAEGCDHSRLLNDPANPGPPVDSYRPAFWNLWDSFNAKRGFGWDANPWVFAYTFELLKGGE